MKLVLDVSNVNPITLPLLHRSKAVALIAKATEGTSFVDKTLGDHRTDADLVGIPFGSYLFLHPDSKDSEAAFYLKTARPKAGDIQPIVDAEVTGLGTDALATRAYSCLRALAYEGYNPILYASAGIWTQLIAVEPRLKAYRIWEAQYPGKLTRWFPRIATLRLRLRHNVSVVLWQWTDSYEVNEHRYDASALLTDIDNIRIPKATLTDDGGGVERVA